MKDALARLREAWGRLYPCDGDEPDARTSAGMLSALEADIAAAREAFGPRKGSVPMAPDLVYALYPDSFDGGLAGAARRVPELRAAGVRTLWVLPPLDSPGRDQGFDIRDHYHIAEEYGGDAAFDRLVEAARGSGMRVIFDIAINHTSDEHPWFAASAAGDPEYRDFYHWADDDSGYAQAALIFPDMVTSNWTRHALAGKWYFHRFYPFQPDLNYANPRVAREMARVLLYWKARGADGFRMDAAPHIWKREGTNCDNQPEAHLVLRIFRAALDAVEPGTLLVAESAVPPEDLLPYFGDGQECGAAYHFPLMPRFWQALAEGDPGRLARTSFPPLPEGCAWFTFLRCHDEVTLDLLPAPEREALAKRYLRDPRLSFRNGRAFSGRLFDLLDRDPERTLAAFSLLLSMPGTPVLYYGDEIAMTNNEEFWRSRTERTGFRDSRFFHRGPFDATREAEAIADPGSAPGRVRAGLFEMLALRSRAGALADTEPILAAEGSALKSVRSSGGRTLEIVTNCAGTPVRAFGIALPPWGRRWTLR